MIPRQHRGLQEISSQLVISRLKKRWWRYEAASESQRKMVLKNRETRNIPTSIMQLIPLSQPEFLGMLSAYFFVRQSFHCPSVELVKHLKLLRVVIVVVKELACLDASLEHGSPHAKGLRFAVVRATMVVFRVWRSGIAWQRGKVR